MPSPKSSWMLVLNESPCGQAVTRGICHYSSDLAPNGLASASGGLSWSQRREWLQIAVLEERWHSTLKGPLHFKKCTRRSQRTVIDSVCQEDHRWSVCEARLRAKDGSLCVRGTAAAPKPRRAEEVVEKLSVSSLRTPRAGLQADNIGYTSSPDRKCHA
ncbi:hypothetical protein EYF80_007966 [Liparis tanakae]|uniref:Uncharacterized protein n=1 Tax=Liparis tanakae TaxID=230148 RepID=A0A4Z2IVQ9_9TELE|nr:hypothetical protein EYF80_007966 [Liparis tanakae]